MRPYSNRRIVASYSKLRRKPLKTIHSYKDCGVKKRPSMSISPHHKMRGKTFVGSCH